MTAGKIHIGTSGWHYMHWLGVFYPASLQSANFLDYYHRKFPTVEINNSFYRLPSEETLKTWRRHTPDHFLFAIKASRYITHMKKLRETQKPLHEFLHRVELLGGKLGPILFQLPPHWYCNVERLRQFLALLPDRFRYTFEFRDESWFKQDVYEALGQAGAALCIYHLAGFLSPTKITTDFVYIRLHGPEGSYQGKYNSPTLADWADAFAAWQRQGKEIFCYFDNDENGYAAINALELTAMVNKLEHSKGKTL